MNNTTYPCTNLLPVADLMATFKANEFSSHDTDYVGGVDSNNIAICEINEDNIADRHTIDNSKKLGGIPAENYLRDTYRQIIESETALISEMYKKELINLKDEFYQMKTSLSKKGLIEDTASYYGYSDFFSSTNKKYDNSAIPILNIINDIESTTIEVNRVDVENVNIGDYLIAESDYENNNIRSVIFKVLDIVYISDKANIITKIGISLSAANTVIKKSKGNYVNDKFTFAKLGENFVTNNRRYTMVNDDENLADKFITIPRGGYGVRLRVPGGVSGALDGFIVKLKHKGNPGPLKCIVYKEDAISTIHNFTEARQLGLVIAESEEVVTNDYTSRNSGFDTRFEFKNKELIENGERYVFTIISTGTDESYDEFGNEWAVSFAYNRLANGGVNDLQTNSESYTYRETSSFGMNSLAFSPIANYDMYFILSTYQVNTSIDTIPVDEGLYTASFPVVNNIDLLKTNMTARLSLRINKEGQFKITSNDNVFNSENYFIATPKILHERAAAINSFHIGDTVIINNNIREITDINTDYRSFAINKPLYIESNSSIYKVAYTPQLKIDIKVNGLDYRSIIKKFNLVSVIPFLKKQNDNVSDRLIYEVDLTDIKSHLDASEDITSIELINMQLQIKWDSNISFVELPSEIAKLHEGAINDLSLCFESFN